MENTELNLMKALEKLGLEYKEIINSKEYKMGKIVSNPSCWLSAVVEKMKFVFFGKKKIDRINSLYVQSQNNNDDVNVLDNYGVLPVTSAKIVVYTCITGNYDNPLVPVFKNDNVTYVLFTDNNAIKTDIWQVRNIPDSICKIKDNTLINRYIKMHPHEIFAGEFDFSIYIDGNVRVISDLSAFTNKCNLKSGVAMFRHVQRICIYKEAKVCTLLGKGNAEKITQLMDNYRQEGFPSNYGLYEATIICTDMHNQIAKDVLNAWWDEFIRSEAYRDQLCFPYVVWKGGLSMSDVGCLGDNLYKCPKFIVKSH